MFAHRSYNVAPDIIDAGQGGGSGGGNIINLGMPLGVVIPFAGVISNFGNVGVPDKWLLCDGREVRTDEYQDLFNILGFTYGVAPSTQVQTGIGNYSYNNNTISFLMTTANVFLKIGTYIRPTGFSAGSGADLNGTWILITQAPAIGGTGVSTGTFAQPIFGVGSGNTTGTFSVNRASVPLPNMVGKFPYGANAIGGSPVPASTGGATQYQLLANNLPQHRHGYNLAAGNGYSSIDGSNGNRASISQNYTNGDQTYLNDANNTLVANSPFSILNPYLALNYIIHAKN